MEFNVRHFKNKRGRWSVRANLDGVPVFVGSSGYKTEPEAQLVASQIRVMIPEIIEKFNVTPETSWYVFCALRDYSLLQARKNTEVFLTQWHYQQSPTFPTVLMWFRTANRSQIV